MSVSRKCITQHHESTMYTLWGSSLKLFRKWSECLNTHEGTINNKIFALLWIRKTKPSHNVCVLIISQDVGCDSPWRWVCLPVVIAAQMYIHINASWLLCHHCLVHLMHVHLSIQSDCQLTDSVIRQSSYLYFYYNIRVPPLWTGSNIKVLEYEITIWKGYER